MTPKKPLHVTLISHSADLAGAELSLLEQALAFQNEGIIPTVILPRTGPLEEALRAEGISTIRQYFPWIMTDKPHSPLSSALRKRLNQLAAMRLFASTRSNAPEIVITNTTVIGVGHYLAKLHGATHLWFAHEVPSQFHGRAGMLHFLGKAGSPIIGNSQHTIDAWPSQTSGQLTLHPTPHYPIIRPERLSRPAQSPPNPSPTARLNLASVGRICAAKNQKLILDLARAFAPNYGSVHIHLIGSSDPVYQKSLLLELEADPAATQIQLHLHPHHPAPFSQIPTDSLFVQPSPTETLGRTTVEAMASGFLVLVVNQGGSTELVDSEETRGLLFSPPAQGVPDELNHLVSRLGDMEWKTRTRQDATRFARTFADATPHLNIMKTFGKR